MAAQCGDTDSGGEKPLSFQNDRAKWKAVLPDAGATCGETDFMYFKVATLQVSLTVSLSPGVSVLSSSLPVCLPVSLSSALTLVVSLHFSLSPLSVALYFSQATG